MRGFFYAHHKSTYIVIRLEYADTAASKHIPTSPPGETPCQRNETTVEKK